MKPKILVFILLACIFFVPVLNAEESSAGRSAVKEDLEGCWEFIPLPRSDMNKVNPWPQPYQWFCFYADGKFVSLQSTQAATHSLESLLALFAPVKDSSQNYKFDRGALIITNPDIKNHREIWVPNLFTHDAQYGPVSVKNGDIIMSWVDPKNPETFMYLRHIRKLK